MKGLVVLLICFSFGWSISTIISDHIDKYSFPNNCNSEGQLDPSCLSRDLLVDVADVLIALSKAWPKMDEHHKIILTISVGKEYSYGVLSKQPLIQITEAILTQPEKHRMIMKLLESYNEKQNTVDTYESSSNF